MSLIAAIAGGLILATFIASRTGSRGQPKRWRRDPFRGSGRDPWRRPPRW